MATTGTASFPSTTSFPSATDYPGQGEHPYIWVLYTTDDAAVASPNWLDATSKARNWGVLRGRESEQGEVDAGTADITVDNRTREFDHIEDPLIRPMNRWWIRSQFTGETQDRFKGYAEAYARPKPDGFEMSDAIIVVHCADEQKVLTLDALPTTSPPRGGYADVVLSDNPAGYWPLDEDPATLVQSAVVPPSPEAPPVGPVHDPNWDVGGESAWWSRGGWKK